mmetsp:Transcript_20408/g.41171  ORF Transcript_20408/g.41171 Transcript_20408/m.41171 type:complete len:92 (+) Transcript_20408:467-742(+)
MHIKSRSKIHLILVEIVPRSNPMGTVMANTATTFGVEVTLTLSTTAAIFNFPSPILDFSIVPGTVNITIVLVKATVVATAIKGETVDKTIL